MNMPMKKGFGFGLVSGIITTLGLIVGLNASTHSVFIVLGGVFMIAVADGMSDALGIHISEEAEGHKSREIWESTIMTFLSKFAFAMSFAVPILFLPFPFSITVSILWGLLLIGAFSHHIAKANKKRPHWTIFEHVLIAVFVIALTHYIGTWVSGFI